MISNDLPIKEVIQEQMKYNAVYNIRLLRSNLEYTANWCDTSHQISTISDKNSKVKQVKKVKL